MKWLCCQLGAREHYAIPRALFRLDMLECLLTDAWVPPTSILRIVRGRRFARANPSFGGSEIRGRWDEELRDARVTGFNWSRIWFETLAKAKHLNGWPLIIARNEWFQRKVVSALADIRPLTSDPLIIFSYSYTALEPFRNAKSRGWHTVLGQIDAGPVEEKIVAEEVAREPELGATWQPAPQAYWDLWREECELADRIVVNSEWSRSCLVKAGVNDSKLFVIPLAYEAPEVSRLRIATARQGGQESAAFAEAPAAKEVGSARSYPARFTQERPLRVLFLGLVNVRKGVARLLEAARMLRDEPVEFWLVGPVEIANATAIVDAGRVKWFGPVARNQATEFYRDADVFILPTLSDGFAITQLEAQAHGLPLIVSSCCGDVVQHNTNGLLLNDPSVELIASAIRFCLQNLSELARFSRCSTVRENYSVTRLGERLFAVAPITLPASV
jgi:glycosyltransferase involved in cell wall biosynthesis